MTFWILPCQDDRMLNESKLAMLENEQPGLWEDLATYRREAEFGTALLQSSLAQLEPGAQLIEVGSGIGLLALMIADQGFSVTAVEPADAGFQQMRHLNDLVREAWEGDLPRVNWLDSTGELFEIRNGGRFDFAYSLNVMEHVQSVPAVVKNTVRHMKPGAQFRFICPNYDFPYEPHFNIPTLWAKSLTHRAFRRRIEASVIVSHPHETWASLSWPSVRTLKRDLPKDLNIAFSRDATVTYFDRLGAAPDFVERKGRCFASLQRATNRLGTDWIRYAPIQVLPVIDCRVASPGVRLRSR